MDTRISNPPDPFLLSYSTARTAHPEIAGHYCDTLCVWVVNHPNGVRPIIECDAVAHELVTKTLVQQESDDERLTYVSADELATKTKVETESDDDISPYSLLELVTKTDHQIESDDQSRSIF